MDYARARLNMVANQLRPNRIEDLRLLDAMREVPRERFLPKPCAASPMPMKTCCCRVAAI